VEPLITFVTTAAQKRYSELNQKINLPSSLPVYFFTKPFTGCNRTTLFTGIFDTFKIKIKAIAATRKM